MDEDSVDCLCVQAPDCSVVGVGEKILLFRHQPASELLLQRLTAHDELQDGDLIEVIIAGQRSTAWSGFSVEHLSVIYWLFIPSSLILVSESYFEGTLFVNTVRQDFSNQRLRAVMPLIT